MMYTFHLCRANGQSHSFEALELPGDADAFATSAELLKQHLSYEHIEVWADERAVLALHRDQPILRPIREEGARRSSAKPIRTDALSPAG